MILILFEGRLREWNYVDLGNTIRMGDYFGSGAAILACRVILAEVGVARSQIACTKKKANDK